MSFRHFFALAALSIVTACSTLPAIEHKTYRFPKELAFVGDVKRPYRVLGVVRTKVEYPTLDMDSEENLLCANYYNKAAADLVKRARDAGGDAVIDVRSIVFLEDGKQETYQTPECSDDGQEGQILLQGAAVRWVPQGLASPGPSGAPVNTATPMPLQPIDPASFPAVSPAQ